MCERLHVHCDTSGAIIEAKSERSASSGRDVGASTPSQSRSGKPSRVAIAVSVSRSSRAFLASAERIAEYMASASGLLHEYPASRDVPARASSPGAAHSAVSARTSRAIRSSAVDIGYECRHGQAGEQRPSVLRPKRSFPKQLRWELQRPSQRRETALRGVRRYRTDEVQPVDRRCYSEQRRVLAFE